MAYSDKVVDHYNNPRNVGTLDKAAGDVGTGLVGAPECGDATPACRSQRRLTAAAMSAACVPER